MNNEANNWLKKRKVKSFYNLVTEDSFLSGVRSMIQVTKHNFLRLFFLFKINIYL